MCGQIDQKSRGGGTSAEEKIVNDLQKRIKNLDPTKPTHRVPEPDLRNDILSSLDQIHQLSRRNLFPGVGQSRCESWTKSVYNDNVHRLRFPETDEHKLRKNEFSEYRCKTLLTIKSSRPFYLNYFKIWFFRVF